MTELLQVHPRVPNQSPYILRQHKEAAAFANSATLKMEALRSSETCNRKHAVRCRNEEGDHQCNLHSMHSYSPTALRRFILSLFHSFVHSFACYVKPGESSLVSKLWSWTILDPISIRHKKYFPNLNCPHRLCGSLSIQFSAYRGTLSGVKAAVP